MEIYQEIETTYSREIIDRKNCQLQSFLLFWKKSNLNLEDTMNERKKPDIFALSIWSINCVFVFQNNFKCM